MEEMVILSINQIVHYFINGKINSLIKTIKQKVKNDLIRMEIGPHADQGCKYCLVVF